MAFQPSCPRTRRGRALRNFGAAVIDCDDVPLNHPRAETYDSAVAPHFRADSFARKHRGREAPRYGGKARGVIRANRFEQSMARHAEGCEPMQDRPREPRDARECRLGMSS